MSLLEVAVTAALPSYPMLCYLGCDLPAKLGADPGPEQAVIIDQNHPRLAHFRPAGLGP